MTMTYEEFLKEQIEMLAACLDVAPDNDMAHGQYSAFCRALDEWRKHQKAEKKTEGEQQ